MALQTLAEAWLPPAWFANISGWSSMQVNASGEKAAMIVRVPATGDITAVGVYITAVVAAQALSVSLETVDANGDPSGSAYGGSTAGSIASPAAGWYTVTLGAQASATVGDIVAVVVQFSGTVGDVSVGRVGCITAHEFPYADLYTTSWAKSTNTPATTLIYGSTYYPNAGFPFSGLSQWTLNTGTSPDEVALKFRLPFPARIAGAWVLGWSRGHTTILYSAADVVLASKAHPAGAVSDIGTARPGQFLFDAGYPLVKNTDYRLAFRPDNANNNRLQYCDVTTAAMMAALPGGASFIASTRADAGAWTDLTTRRPFIGLILDQFDDAVSVGAGGGILMPEGLVQ